jgi:hypothetical protein
LQEALEKCTDESVVQRIQEQISRIEKLEEFERRRLNFGRGNHVGTF